MHVLSISLAVVSDPVLRVFWPSETTGSQLVVTFLDKEMETVEQTRGLAGQVSAPCSLSPQCENS